MYNYVQDSEFEDVDVKRVLSIANSKRVQSSGRKSFTICFVHTLQTLQRARNQHTFVIIVQLEFNKNTVSLYNVYSTKATKRDHFISFTNGNISIRLESCSRYGGTWRTKLFAVVQHCVDSGESVFL